MWFVTFMSITELLVNGRFEFYSDTASEEVREQANGNDLHTIIAWCLAC